MQWINACRHPRQNSTGSLSPFESHWLADIIFMPRSPAFILFLPLRSHAQHVPPWSSPISLLDGVMCSFSSPASHHSQIRNTGVQLRYCPSGLPTHAELHSMTITSRYTANFSRRSTVLANGRRQLGLFCSRLSMSIL